MQTIVRKLPVLMLIAAVLLAACEPVPLLTPSGPDGLPASTPSATPALSPVGGTAVRPGPSPVVTPGAESTFAGPAVVAATPLPALTSENTTSTPQTPTDQPSGDGDPGTVRFAVIGDFGLAASAGEAQVAALVASWEPEFIITVGDNNYPSGSERTIDANIGRDYHAFIHPYLGEYGEGADRNRFFPTLGNHDLHTDGGKPHLDYFTLPGNERYYDFTWEPVHFFALSSDPREPDGATVESIQAEWLRGALAESTSCWNLVYFHHAPYSSGPHAPSTWMRWPFAEWGADAVLGGHDHIYERIERDGLPYFVNGLGGSVLYEIGNPIAGSQVRYDENFGAMRVIAGEKSITYEFVNVGGEVIDSYAQDGGCAN